MTVIWKSLLFLWMVVVLWAGLVWAPLVPVLGETTRVLYLHIPSAWVTVVAFAWSMLHSVLYLARRQATHDLHASGAAELGMLFCISATVSGSMWAKAMWGSYWNWDPRETSIFFLLLIYGAYLALRSAIDDEARRARLSAIYSVLAFVTVPFLVFVVPHLYQGLHPDPIINTRGKVEMDPRIRVVFMAAMVGFTVLFAWLLNLRIRVGRLELRRRSVLQ